MSKKLLSLATAASMLFTCMAPVYAETKTYEVNYDGSSLTQAFPEGAFDGMQPGDEAEISVTLSNSSKNSTGWYMKHSIIDTLEKGASDMNGAYDYELSYNGAVIYSSKTVGGTEFEGLQEVGDYFGDGESWFYLGDIDSSKTANISLSLVLDGETQNNNYQETFGSIGMQFAVENTSVKKVTKHEEKKTVKRINTGAENGYSFYTLIAMISGLLLIVLAFLLGKKEKEEA